jgi:ribonucleoside-diphosphate reductase alpha chain
MSDTRGARVRPEQTRTGFTWTLEIRGPQRRTKAHVTINRYPNGLPCEIFVSVAKVGSDLRTSFEAWAMTASSALQHGVPAAAVAKSIRHIKDDSAGEVDGESVSSLWDAIAQLLEPDA